MDGESPASSARPAPARLSGRRTGTVPPGPALSGGIGRRVSARLPGPDSGWGLVAVAAAFTLSQLLFVSMNMGLSWDESVYVSQVSSHVPAAYFDPARARGVP